jgi:hypothetical protein
VWQVAQLQSLPALLLNSARPLAAEKGCEVSARQRSSCCCGPVAASVGGTAAIQSDTAAPAAARNLDVFTGWVLLDLEDTVRPYA